MNAIQGKLPGVASCPPTTESCAGPAAAPPARCETVAGDACAIETMQIASSGKTDTTAAAIVAVLGFTVDSSAPGPCRFSQGTAVALSLDAALAGPLGTTPTGGRGAALLAGEAVGEVDGDDRDQHDEHGDDVDDRQLAGPEEVVEDPDRQRLVAGAEREAGDDDLVEGEREGEQGAGRRAPSACWAG